MVWLANSFEVFRQSLLGLLRGRMTWLVALMIPGLCVFGLLLPEQATEDVYGTDLFGIITSMFYLQMALPFSAMFFGVQTVHGDIEDRTVNYLFARPVHRSSILVGKWVGVTVVTAGLACLAVGALYVGLAAPERVWRGDAPPESWEIKWYFLAILLSSSAYAAVAVLFGAYFKRPMLWAALFVLGWELFASNLPPEAGVRTMTVADPVRRFILASLELEPGSPLSQVLWPDYTSWSPEEMGSPVRTVFFFIATCLGLGLWVYGRTEYDSRPRE